MATKAPLERKMSMSSKEMLLAKLDTMNVISLRKTCENFNLDAAGSRAGLLSRLKEHLGDDGETKVAIEMNPGAWLGTGGSVSRSPSPRAPNTAPVPRRATFEDVRDEVLNSAGGKTIQQRDSDAGLTAQDRFIYYLSNAMAANANLRFWMLIWVTIVTCGILSVLWVEAYTHTSHEDCDETVEPEEGCVQFLQTANFGNAMFMSLQCASLLPSNF